MQACQLSLQQYNIADPEYQHLPYIRVEHRYGQYLYCYLCHPPENILARIASLLACSV